MMTRTLSVAVASGVLLSTLAAQGPRSFRPIASFGVPGGVAEILDATRDGRTVVYSDSSAEEFGVVDISDPTSPTVVGTVAANGEPTSISIFGRWAVGPAWLDKPDEGSPPPAFGPSELSVIDLSDPSNPSLAGIVPIGYHPDSVNLTRVGNDLVAVLAIENEPVVVVNGLVTDEDRPGSPDDVSPAGFVQVIVIDRNNPANSTVTDVPLPSATLQAAGLLYPDDPQPEFVAIAGTTAAVSLQENNGIAILDIADPTNPTLERVFSLGVASSRLTDLTEDDDIRFVEAYPDLIGTPAKPFPLDAGGNPVAGGSRFPDAIAFSPNGRIIYSADEGELNFTGGRGVSAWDLDGNLVWEDGGQLEDVAKVFSHYPEGRSENKGIEMEGVTTASFGSRDYAFFLSERGSAMAVYDITNPRRPWLSQFLPTGISPEGVIAIPDRDLVLTADEESGTLSVFRGRRSRYVPSVDQPTLYSPLDQSWAAISGMTSAGFGNVMWGVPDNALPTAIYAVVAGAPYAPVFVVRNVKRDGQQARYDGEGIDNDTSIVRSGFFGGWWIASEGNASSRPNLLVQVDFLGNVRREIQLPNAIDPAADPAIGGSAQGPAGGQTIRSNGFEGVTVSADGRYLIACIQRDFGGEFTSPRFARIARYDLRQIRDGSAPNDGLRFGGDWEFFYLQLDSDDADNWAGLSEILSIGDGDYAVIERDKGIGLGSELKKVYAFTLNGLSADADGVPDASDTVTKVEVRDVVGAFFPYEKIESLVLTPRRELWIGLDNDGGEVESRLVNTGRFRNPIGR